MTLHLHREYVPGCHRCDLSRDEAVSDTPARHSGTCPECGGRWEPGDLIRHVDVRGEATDFGQVGVWVHAVCPDQPDPLAATHPVCQTCWLTHPEGACDR